MFDLFVAGWSGKVRARTSDIMDIAFEIRHCRDLLCLLDHAFCAPCGNNASLMARDGAERAVAEAPPVARDRKLDFFDRRHIMILRMKGALIRQRIGEVHLLLRKGQGRLIDDHIPAVIRFDQHFRIDCILVLILGHKASGIRFPAGADLVIGRKHNVIIHDMIERLGFPCGAANVAQIPDIHSAGERVRHFDDRVFAHPEHQQVGLAVHQDRAADLVVPVIIMRGTAQARFDAANEYRNMRKQTFEHLGIYDRRPVRPFSHDAVVRIIVLVAASFVDRIMIDHGIDISCADKKSEPRRAELQELFVIVPVGLRKDRTCIPECLERPGDDRTAE